MTVIEELAGWVSGLQLEQIPDRVLELARGQVASVMGAIHAGRGCGGGKAVAAAVGGLGEAGPCACYPGAERRSLCSALLQNCSLSMALDYDDYLFLGHTGHSAVCVPMAVGEMRGADGASVLCAQVAANELGGRLGASVALGPHNGQMWAFIHQLAGAAAASRVMGLDAGRTADAMGIAMSEPVYPLFPGFMGPQSKLLTAATPALTGVGAALLAGSGMTGSRGIIEDARGFWQNFSFIPLPFMMTGLGRAWVTDSLAFKPYPGCAYIDTAMDALFDIRERFAREEGRDLDPGEVRAVKVEASLLTTAMDGMSRMYLDTSRLSPTNINFSLSVSIAIGLLAGRLTGAELTEEFLDGNRGELLSLASRVELSHAAPLTVEFLRALDEAVDLEGAFSQVDFRALRRARRRLGEHVSGVAAMGPRQALEAWRSLSPGDRGFLRGLLSLKGLAGRAEPYDLGTSRLDELRMPFGARVSLELTRGRRLEGEALVPRGAPGDPKRLEVPEAKFLREVSPFTGEEAAARELSAIMGRPRAAGSGRADRPAGVAGVPGGAGDGRAGGGEDPD